MYIVFTGAPGSKWSGVIANIYQSADIDNSDSHADRQYESGIVKHLGSYFDPGMEFENDINNWDKPFNGTGRRIIRSHTFAYQLNRFKDWHPIVMVHRNDVECYDWWCNAGGFSITYPNYAPYYKDLNNMWIEIQKQNSAIMRFVKNNIHNIHRPKDNAELCQLLDIELPKNFVDHNYRDKDITVYVHK